VQVQVLQPSPAGCVSPAVQPAQYMRVHAQPLSVQVQVLQPSPAGIASPIVHADPSQSA
jgi:hypothetical protein